MEIVLSMHKVHRKTHGPSASSAPIHGSSAKGLVKKSASCFADTTKEVLMTLSSSKSAKKRMRLPTCRFSLVTAPERMLSTVALLATKSKIGDCINNS
jgi:hypothetical protein